MIAKSPFQIIPEYQKAPPVDAEALARALGIKVYYLDLGEGVYGVLNRHPDLEEYSFRIDYVKNEFTQERAQEYFDLETLRYSMASSISFSSTLISFSLTSIPDKSASFTVGKVVTVTV